MIGKYRSLGFVAGLAVTALAFTAPVAAQTVSITRDTSVKYTGIDLQTAKGRQTLQHRVNLAINNLCGAPVLESPDEAEAIKACRTDARALAEPKVSAAIAAASRTYASSL